MGNPMEKAERALRRESAMRAEKGRFLAVSYNIHKCIGADGRRKPERIAQALCDLRAPLVGLQEVDSLTTDGSQTEYLARATGLTAIAGPAIRKGRGYYGNVLLTSFPIMETRCLDISVGGSEPRSVIDAILNIDRIPVRVLVTHLGLIPWERHRQVKRLLDLLSVGSQHVVIVLGDINEWAPFSPRIRALHEHMGEAPGPRTFPSFLPMIALDRIWVRPGRLLKSVRVLKNRLTRVASDHLPVVADIDIRPDLLMGRNGEVGL
jgi:endonuclease/exonuclease/phosphatase family metal-dependent hydrolase